MSAHPILTFCEACGGEGRMYVSAWGYEPGCGHAHNHFEDDRGECQACEGHGRTLVESQPVNLDDLDDIECGLILHAMELV